MKVKTKYLVLKIVLFSFFRWNTSSPVFAYAFLELGIDSGVIVARTDSLGTGLTKQIAVSHEPGLFKIATATTTTTE